MAQLPEDISLHKKRISAEFIEAEVYVVEPLGSEIIVDLKLGENLLKAKTGPTVRVHIGEKVWMGFNRDRMHIFDKKTTEAIF